MSAVVKTLTPFIDEECLCEALIAIGCKFQIIENKIITDKRDLLLGFQEFRKDNYGKYIFFAYSHLDRDQVAFIREVEKQYNIIYQKKLEEIERLQLEEEKKRLEQERLAFIEKQKNAIIERANQEGYYIKQKEINGKIKIILSRNTY